MRTYKIALNDQITGERTLAEKFKGNRVSLKARMKKLQLGYCEGEQPRFSEVTKNGKTALVVSSTSDYFCTAIIEMTN